MKPYNFRLARMFNSIPGPEALLARREAERLDAEQQQREWEAFAKFYALGPLTQARFTRLHGSVYEAALHLFGKAEL